MMDRVLHRFADCAPIDVSCMIGDWPSRREAGAQISDLQDLVERFSFSAALVGHVAGVFDFETRSSNEALLRALESTSMLISMPTLNPLSPCWEGELEWLAEHPIGGIRLFPGYHRYDLEHPAVGAVLDQAAARRLAVHVSVRLLDDRLQHPQLRCDPPAMSSVARLIERAAGALIISGLKASEIRVVQSELAHEAGLGRAVFDLWHINGPLGVVEDLMGSDLADRTCFGSGFPLQSTVASVMKAAAARVSESELRALCRSNALAHGVVSESWLSTR